MFSLNVIPSSFFSIVIVFCSILFFTGCGSSGSSENDSSAIVIQNTAPVANAGDDQTGQTGILFSLDGSSSSDQDGDSISYQWSIASQPVGSSATLSSSSIINPTITPDIEGNYQIELVVNDGTTNSNIDEITITVNDPITNNSPIAVNRSETIVENTETEIQLEASDSDGDSLTFSIESQPLSGTITLTNDIAIYTPNTGFFGNDSFNFTASDGEIDSNIATITILVEEAASTTTLSDGKVVDTAALVSLGNLIYHDTNLSTPAGQSCASCHDLTTGFDDPDEGDPSSLGADAISFGTRNSPTASYAAFVPEPRQVGPGGGQLVGGLFLDGRAASLEEQAKAPLLNPVEMGNEDEQEVIDKIALASYADDFKQLFGGDILDNSLLAYDYIADAIAAFERTDLFSPFSSKFDQVQSGETSFTAAEARGQQLFRGKADCARCHSDNDAVVVFSNFEYKNIGVPSNPSLPEFMNDPTFVDFGLGAESGNINNNGQFRTPTLRNIAITAPYMHNGAFNTLEEVIDFYNTRDTTFADAPEVNENVDQGGNIGELNLTTNEVSDLIAFLNTLTD